MNGLTFDINVKTQLAPVLDPGTGVILDNPPSHKSPRAAKALRRKGCWVLFLPPYSPDLNPPLVDCLAINERAVIEMAFSKLKAHLRRIGARPFDALFDALEHICNIFKPEESNQRNAGTSPKQPGMPQIKRKPL